MTNIEAGTRKVKKEEKAALKAAGCNTVEPLVATNSCKQPVFPNTKSFQVKPLHLEALSKQPQPLLGLKFCNFLLLFTSCK